MTDNNNVSNKGSGEDSTPDNGAGQLPANEPDTSKGSQNVDPAEQARRDQQSKKDQALAQNDEYKESLDFLMADANERAKETAVKSFLTENKDKYPNVTAEDLKFATSEEDLELLAKNVENTFRRGQQAAIGEVQDQSLTPEQLAEQEKALAEETEKTGRSTFGSWLSKKQRTK